METPIGDYSFHMAVNFNDNTKKPEVGKWLQRELTTKTLWHYEIVDRRQANDLT